MQKSMKQAVCKRAAEAIDKAVQREKDKWPPDCRGLWFEPKRPVSINSVSSQSKKLATKR